MKTRNLLIAVLLIGGLAFSSCQKENGLLPASTNATADASMKANETGQIWSVDADPLSNFPDPFVETTTIEYRMNKAGYVRLAIVGEDYASIAVLVNGHQEAGVYRVEFDARDLKPGLYIAQLRHNGVTVKEEMHKIEGTGIGNPIAD